MSHEQNVLRSSWEGGFPCEVRLDAADVATTTVPEPVFLMMKRNSYLPVALKPALEVFEEFVLETPAEASELWFETEALLPIGDRMQATPLPLNWHIPAGVLYDIVTSISLPEANSGNYARPWRIIVHYRGLPIDKVPRCAPGIVRTFFFNAVKQALYIESGTVQRWFRLPVAKQDQLYEGLVAGDADVFLSPHAAIATPLQELRQIPVRILGCQTVNDGDAKGVVIVDPGVALQSFVQLALPLSLDVGGLLDLLRSRYAEILEDAKVIINGVLAEDDWRLLETWKLLQCPDHFLYVYIKR